MRCSEEWPTASGDYYQCLLRRERCFDSSKDSKERKLCLQWLVRAGEEYGFRVGVTSVAALYFDRFLAHARSLPGCEELNFKQLIRSLPGIQKFIVVESATSTESALCELVCIVCLSIAAKQLEPQDTAPHLGDFEEYYSFSDLRQTEAVLLDALNWDLASCSASTFAHFWLSKTSEGTQQQELHELADHCIQKCIPEVEFADVKPSVLGAATVMWAHLAMNSDLEQWDRVFQAHLQDDTEHALEVVEVIGQLMEPQFPHAYIQRRASSPNNVFDVAATQFCGSVQPGLKRPTPGRAMLPAAKKLKKVDDGEPRTCLTEAGRFPDAWSC